MAAIKAQGSSLASDLQKLLESSAGADVALVAGESELRAHSLILAARSPVFAAMLRTDMREARSRHIEITDVQAAVLRQLLLFIYTDRSPQLGSMAVELLAASDKYDLPLLKGRCERQLARDLAVENAAATAAAALLHRCPGLRDAAVRFIAAHRAQVEATGGWPRLLAEGAEEVAERLAAEAAAEAAAGAPGPQAPPGRMLTEEEQQALARQLISAAYEGQTGEMRALLAAGAAVNGSGGLGDTALHAAVESCREEAVRCLLDAGADVNARDPQGRTPLHFAAAASGHQHLVWMLLAAAARVDAQDHDGRTPLYLAALFGCAFAARALLLAGASVDVRDNMGYTPADVATSRTQSLFNTQ